MSTSIQLPLRLLGQHSESNFLLFRDFLVKKYAWTAFEEIRDCG